MPNAENTIRCAACGRENEAGARTCRNCAASLAAAGRRDAEHEANVAAELSTVQNGSWQGVSVRAVPGAMPLPPQLQAEALRRERDAARLVAQRKRLEEARARAEEAVARARQEGEARQANARTVPPPRVCARCGTVHPLATSFCLGCGASFAGGAGLGAAIYPAPPPVIIPPVLGMASAPPPPTTVTSPVGVLREQARRQVRVESLQGLASRPAPAAPARVRQYERAEVLPATETTPYVAALLSFLLPGTGQLRNAQWLKGMSVLFLAYFALFVLPIGLWTLTAVILRSLLAVDAYRIGVRRLRGERVRAWQWDFVG